MIFIFYRKMTDNYKILNDSVLSFIKEHPDNFSYSDIILGLKKARMNVKDKRFNILRDSANQKSVRKNESLVIGWLIGTKYVGTCGESWGEDSLTSKFVEALGSIHTTNSFDWYDYCESCNCGNGTCCHVVDAITLLKYLLGDEWNPPLEIYGYYDKQ